jgi:DNA polymerase-1
MTPYDFYLIDSHNLAYRCWWAVRSLKHNDIHTGLEFGFIRKIINLIKLIPANQVYLAWDGRPSRCLELLPDYKTGRVKVNSEEPSWTPRLERLMTVCSNICNTIYHPEEEADEQIAKFIKMNSDKKCIIISNDKDLQQFINKNVHVESSGNLIDEEKVKEEWGIPAYKIPLYKALDGDSSDNIKGVPRLQTKTKIKLVNSSETIDELIQNFKDESLTVKEREKLSSNIELVLNNYKVVNLLNLEGNYNLIKPNKDMTELNKIIEELNLSSIKLEGIL